MSRMTLARKSSSSQQLKEILASFPTYLLDQPCQDQHLSEIASDITNWPSLIPHLNVSADEREAILRTWPSSRSRQNLEFLLEWKRSYGRKATYRLLCEAFSKAGMMRLSRKLCHIVENECDSSSLSEGSTSEIEFSEPVVEKKTVHESGLSHCHEKTIKPYAEYLRTMYAEQIPSASVKWPPQHSYMYFNLAMIRQDGSRSWASPDEVTRMTVAGSIDMIMKYKTPIQLSDLFVLDSQKRKVILIEGAPGIGKSTLSWQLCTSWGKKELFQEYKVVIYQQLRNPEIQSAQSLADLLPEAHVVGRATVVAEIQKSAGDGVLFILDGWDEFPPGLKSNSLFRQLICDPQKLTLDCSTLVITSRPIASQELQPYATSRVEILGFSRCEIRHYFECTMVNPEAVNRLLMLLESHPHIMDSCHIPLNAAIVAHVFITEGIVPSTLHQMISFFIIHVLRRHIMSSEGRVLMFESFCDLPPDLEVRFRQLCHLAFEGTMLNQVSFTGKQVSECNTLDLTQAVKTTHGSYFHFLHLTIQEFLSSVHISQMPSNEQIEVFQKMFCNPRFANVLKFYAAATKLQTEGIREIAAKIAESGKKEPLLNLLHCLYEAQDADLCCFIAFKLNGALDLSHLSLAPYDCFSVGCFIANVCQNFHTDIQIKLSSCSLDDYDVSYLAKGMSMKIAPFHCVTLNLDSNNIHGSGVRCLCKEIELICSLDLSLCKIQEGEPGLGYLVQALKTNSTLVHLSICSNRNLSLSEKEGQMLEGMLKMNKTLQELKLSGNAIGVSGLACIAEGMSYNTGVLSLSLSDCAMTEDSGALLEKMLATNNTLKELDLSCNNISTSGLIHICHGLCFNKALMKLSLARSLTHVRENIGQVLGEVVFQNNTLETLELGGNKFGDEDLVLLGVRLQHNHGLKILSLDNLEGISVRGWIEFISHLDENCCLQTLITPKFSELDASMIRQRIDAVNKHRQLKCLPFLELSSLTDAMSKVNLSKH